MRGATSTASSGWCTERRRLVVEFWLALVNAAIVIGCLLRRAWSCHRCPPGASRGVSHDKLLTSKPERGL
jgi:hypothetical protein